jgi:ubiquinone/menaquinone biosynthesis C-methylase UbiE
VLALDISPELLDLARRRLDSQDERVSFRIGSAYDTGIDDQSVDVIFCMSLLHHLDIVKARNEMLRVLSPNGCIVMKEPIRFSTSYTRLRSLLPDHNVISDFEHPLTHEELSLFREPFQVEGLRYFRLPIVPLAMRWSAAASNVAYKISAWTLRNCPATKAFATSAVMRLRRKEIAESVARA